MKYSIFHTSHCGSTLLACMLSNSIDTVTEPKWTHDIRKESSIDNKMKLVTDNHKDNLLVKYPSLVTEVAPNVEGKKVFLFRNIIDHLQYLEKNTEEPGDINEAKFWLFRWQNLLESKDVLFMQHEQFINNKEQACKEICKHFDIEYKPAKTIDFHVKEAGYNHNDEPIRLR